MKRIPAGLVAVVAVLGMGALTSACDVTPNAASVNGATVSVAALNTRLGAIEQFLQCGAGDGIHSLGNWVLR